MPHPFQTPRNRQAWKTLIVVVAVCGSFAASLLFVLLGYVLLRQTPSEKLRAEIPQAPLKKPDEARSKGDAEKPPVPQVTVESATLIETPDIPEKTPIVLNPEPVAPVEPPELPHIQALDDIRDRNNRLSLPPWNGAGGFSAGTSSGVILAKVVVNSPHDCDLTLVGIEKAFGTIPITIELEDKGEMRTWTVVRKAFGLNTKTETLGAFKLERQNLSFHWNSRIPPSVKPNALRFCMLEVQVGDEKELCRLSGPEIAEAMKLDKFPIIKHDLEPRLDASHLPDIKNVLLEIRPVGLPGRIEQEPAEPIAPGNTQAIRIFGDEKAGLLIQLDALLQFDNENDGNRGIVIAAKETSLKNATGELGVEEALSVARSLNPLEMKKRKKDLEQKLTAYEREQKKLEKNLAGQRPKLVLEMRRLEKLISALQAGGEREKEVAKSRQEEKAALEAALERLESGVKAKAQQRDEELARIDQFDAAIKLTEEIAQGRLEFCVFVMVGDERIELYKSKGFAAEL